MKDQEKAQLKTRTRIEGVVDKLRDQPVEPIWLGLILDCLARVQSVPTLDQHTLIVYVQCPIYTELSCQAFRFSNSNPQGIFLACLSGEPIGFGLIGFRSDGPGILTE